MNPNIKTIVIAYDTSEGTFKISGPMNDGALFLGMLEMAKVTFMETRQEARLGNEEGGSRIVIPRIVAKV